MDQTKCRQGQKKETNNTFVLPIITTMGKNNIMGLSPIEN
jgi:hypothetical protein